MINISSQSSNINSDYTAKGTDVFFSVLAHSSKKINNFSNSVAVEYLNYGCYKEFINILITL